MEEEKEVVEPSVKRYKMQKAADRITDMLENSSKAEERRDNSRMLAETTRADRTINWRKTSWSSRRKNWHGLKRGVDSWSGLVEWTHGVDWWSGVSGLE